MQIDPRLNQIDDCLYRVSVRAAIVEGGKALLVQEVLGGWWAFPGGGVDHGETIETALTREVEEELGVPAASISSDFQIAHYEIGNVVDGVPRMNLYFKVSVPDELLGESTHIRTWQWFTKNEFLKLKMHPSYNNAALAEVLFNS